MKPTHLELFAGVGGISLASEWAGFQHVGFVERDEFCQKVLAKNFPEVPIYDDVRTFDGTRFRGVDLISGGFPCQPHSLAGSRKASGDERDLWGEVVRIVGEAKPRWFLGENVPGLFSSESGAFFGRILNDLAALGYRVGWAMYGASDVGAVHRRNRVFIVAYSEHNGLSPRKVRRGIGKSKGKRRLPQPERRPIDRPRDWREWGIESTIRESRFCRSDDGFSTKLDRINRLKALGNAVVPSQILPILQAIAEALQND